jgi:Fe-S cluster biogenesis protein NfuA
MARAKDARATGERVEALLAELRTRAGPQVGAAAEELVGCLVELYGTGLTTIVTIVLQEGEAGTRLLEKAAADPLVESLLLLHDLHPLDTEARIQRALDRVLPQLGSHAGEVEYLGIDEQGIVQLRLQKSSHGCGTSPSAVRQGIEDAVTDAAPETTGIEIEEVAAQAELPLLQIMRRPTATQPAGTQPAGTHSTGARSAGAR